MANPQTALSALLQSLFSPDELRRFLVETDDTLAASPPPPDQALALLRRHGLVDDAFFDRLVREKPSREEEIRKFQEAWEAAEVAAKKTLKTLRDAGLMLLIVLGLLGLVAGFWLAMVGGTEKAIQDGVAAQKTLLVAPDAGPAAAAPSPAGTGTEKAGSSTSTSSPPVRGPKE
jgi:hypothetical protein